MTALYMCLLKFIDQSFHVFSCRRQGCVSVSASEARGVASLKAHLQVLCQFTVHTARQELLVHDGCGDAGSGNVQAVAEIILQRVLYFVVIGRGGEKFARFSSGAHATGVSDIAPELVRALLPTYST